MEEIATVGLDLAKSVFQVHGSDQEGRPVLRKKLRRGQVIGFFAKLPACVVGMEACGSAHYWARELQALGHKVRLIPPQYVKPFIVSIVDRANASATERRRKSSPQTRVLQLESEFASRESLSQALGRVREAVFRFFVNHPRQEPGALAAHAGICAGGAG